MKRRTLLRSEAQSDIREAVAWYEARAIGLGLRFLREIQTTLKHITDNPGRFPIIMKMCAALLHKFPYSVYFVNQAEKVAIIAVLHQHRQPDDWKIATIRFQKKASGKISPEALNCSKLRTNNAT